MALKIIAEIAQGYEGRPVQAMLLLQAAAKAAADAAKFQVVFADELGTPDYKHYGLFKSLQMDDEEWVRLGRCAEELGIELHLDVFGLRSLAIAINAGAQAIKIHSTDILNIGLLNAVAESPIHQVLLGAGGTSRSDILNALNFLRHKRVVVLLGFQGYPTPNEANQIARVRHLIAELLPSHPTVAVGFADHAPPDSPLSISLAAMALGAGATVIEKHLTLGRVMKLEDHESALSPDEFGVFANTLRDCAAALDKVSPADDFGMHASELEYRNMVRKHVVAMVPIPAGTVIGAEHIVLKRTPSGNTISDIASVYGRRAKRTLEPNVAIAPLDIESNIK